MKMPFREAASMMRAAALSLSMLLGAAPAAASEATSVVEQEPGGEGSICDVCGPAPCCVILWTAWCGCPFGGKDDRVVSNADTLASDGLMACGAGAEGAGGVGEEHGGVEANQVSSL